MSYKEKRQHDRLLLRKAVYNKFGGYCAYCGCDLKNTIFHVDHLVPKRRKASIEERKILPTGTDDFSNLMPACDSCNSCKSDLTLEEFRYRVSDRIFRLNEYSSEYQIAKRFGLITENNIHIQFHFEKS